VVSIALSLLLGLVIAILRTSYFRPAGAPSGLQQVDLTPPSSSGIDSRSRFISTHSP
jgi:hypothetical protein